MTDLMERYDALNMMSEYPADYCERLNKLAAEFALAGRYSMATTVRRRAEHYSKVRIDGHPARVVRKTTIKTPHASIVYLDVAR